MLWDLNEGKHLYTLDSGDVINALCFSPNRYWLCAATGPSIKIWVWLLIGCCCSTIYWFGVKGCDEIFNTNCIVFDDIRGCFWAPTFPTFTVTNLSVFCYLYVLQWFHYVWLYLHVGSWGQDHCGRAETRSDQHKQQGWTPTVYFPGMVCWWTGTQHSVHLLVQMSVHQICGF